MGASGRGLARCPARSFATMLAHSVASLRAASTACDGCARQSSQLPRQSQSKTVSCQDSQPDKTVAPGPSTSCWPTRSCRCALLRPPATAAHTSRQSADQTRQSARQDSQVSHHRLQRLRTSHSSQRVKTGGQCRVSGFEGVGCRGCRV